MNTISKRLRYPRTTSGAVLRRVRGVDFDDPSTGAFSLVLDHRSQHPERRVHGGFAQAAVLGHESKAQILEGDQAGAIDDAAADLVQMVAPPVRDALVLTGKVANGLPAAPAALCSPGNSTGEPAKPCLPSPVVIHWTREGAVIQSNCTRQPQVYTDSGALGQRGRGGKCDRELHIPAVQPAHDAGLFDRGFVWDRSVPLDLDAADVLDVEAITGDPGSLVVCKRYRSPAGLPLEPWKARLLARGVGSGKSSERLVEPAEYQLASVSGQGPKAWVRVAQVPPVGALACKFHPVPSFAAPCLDPLFKRKIVQRSCNFKDVVERNGLDAVGVQAVFVSAEERARIAHASVPQSPEGQLGVDSARWPLYFSAFTDYFKAYVMSVFLPKLIGSVV